MTTEKRLINIEYLEPYTVDIFGAKFIPCAALKDVATVDAVEVVPGYHVGDVCLYGFYDGNKSLSLVEIQKILNDERGVAEIKILKVFVDNSGNGWFNYLLKSGGTMNASFEYMKNITPICAKMDGGA